MEENTEVLIDESETSLVDLKSEFEVAPEEWDNDQESESDGVVDVFADLFNFGLFLVVPQSDGNDDHGAENCRPCDLFKATYSIVTFDDVG